MSLTPAGSRCDEFWIDVGGTFTDCVHRQPDNSLRTHKLLSTGQYQGIVEPGSAAGYIIDSRRRADPPDFFTGWTLALRRPAGVNRPPDLPAAPGEPFDFDVPIVAFDPRAGRLQLARPLPSAPAPGWRYALTCGQPAPVCGIRWLLGLRRSEPIGRVRVCLGTTRGTNALLERRGAAVALLTTAGFADLLRIGNQTRPRLFDLHIRKPAPLYRRVVEIEERVDSTGRVLRPLRAALVRANLLELKAEGIESLAIALLNSHRNPLHEQQLADLARELGFAYVSVSSQLSPLQRIVPRAETAVVDAYLAPVVAEYVRELRAALPQAELKLMSSAGTLVDAAAFVARDSILSGPAGGVIGAARAGRQAGCERIIGLDMGGTSTDVSRFDGTFERRYELELEDPQTGGCLRVAAPMLAIETVAAGGGSICGFDGIRPTVGPGSAGADPGPACYGRGGPLCLTDVNLLLGRLCPEHFPFSLDAAAAAVRMNERIDEIERAAGRRYAPHELALGYVQIANARMAAAIRKVSIRRGYDPREYTLVAFGGAGGQHACALAEALGMRRVLVHPLAGVLSAVGIGAAPIARFAAWDVGAPLNAATLAALEPKYMEWERRLRAGLRREGVPDERIAAALRRLDLRYAGQDASLTIDQPADGDWAAAFERCHAQLFGFTFPGRGIEIRAARLELTSADEPTPTRQRPTCIRRPQPYRTQQVRFSTHAVPAAVYLRADLHAGDAFDGPALVAEDTGTVVIPPGWHALVVQEQVLELTLASGRTPPAGRAPADSRRDPVALELFTCAFNAIAEQMGATLERTALSTNVKERLDFSCAVLDAGGHLVAHAPHIPVHLGAMATCVQCILDDVAAGRVAGATGRMRPGEVYITNDPYRGGSHLPDVTVVTPVFIPGRHRPVGFVANRAHHAEIGGITPGSIPPSSRTLAEEGVLIRTMRLMVADPAECGASACGSAAPSAGPRLEEDALRALLSAGAHPSRAVEQNLADIRAQVAANHQGAMLLRELIARHGPAVVQAYMEHIQAAAAEKMQRALRRLPPGPRRFVDALDDGSRIAVCLEVTGAGVRIDFSGSSGVHPGNLNATPSIVTSAVLYCLRCLIGEDVPLNGGLLRPVTIVLPPGLLHPPPHPDPARCPAVVGGNVETSQRIVDCLLGALELAAASQGTMNNLAFGDERFGYYETIGGGSGAGPDFDGADAVHTHMTNTRLTDIEVLEERYPVRVRQFAIRTGSGGRGRHRGGNGIVRELEFLAPLEVSLLTQRRLTRPYGLAGGEPGAPGVNTLVRADGSEQTLAPVCRIRVGPSDRLRIETPGGGGWGRPPS